MSEGDPFVIQHTTIISSAYLITWRVHAEFYAEMFGEIVPFREGGVWFLAHPSGQSARAKRLHSLWLAVRYWWKSHSP